STSKGYSPTWAAMGLACVCLAQSPVTAASGNAYFGTPTAVPGLIEAENFDAGGEGAGDPDNSPGNEGNASFRRGEDVDIFGSNDGGSGSWYIVKNIENGEWLAYTINVSASGSYDIDLRASTSYAFPNSAYHIEIDGSNVTGTVVLPATGGWDNY